MDGDPAAHEQLSYAIFKTLNKSPWISDIQALISQTTDPEELGKGKDVQERWYKGQSLPKCWYDGFLVVSVERIQNPDLWEAYKDKKTQFQKGLLNVERVDFSKTSPHVTNLPEVDPSINEGYFFHYAADRGFAGITKGGFNPQKSSPNGMLGVGCYFAEDITKADQYANPQDTLIRVFLACVCLGRSYATPWKCPGRREPVPGYDSTLAEGARRFREFAVYNKAQAYPRFIVELERHRIECHHYSCLYIGLSTLAGLGLLALVVVLALDANQIVGLVSSGEVQQYLFVHGIRSGSIYLHVEHNEEIPKETNLQLRIKFDETIIDIPAQLVHATNSDRSSATKLPLTKEARAALQSVAEGMTPDLPEYLKWLMPKPDKLGMFPRYTCPDGLRENVPAVELETRLPEEESLIGPIQRLLDRVASRRYPVHRERGLFLSPSLVSVERIENYRKSAYESKKQALIKKITRVASSFGPKNTIEGLPPLNDDINECYLFHPILSRSELQSIGLNGFQKSPGRLGPGVYFHQDLPEEDDVIQVILTRVCLGEPLITKDGPTKPPPHVVLFSPPSLFKESATERTFSIFDPDQASPEFLLTLRRETRHLPSHLENLVRDPSVPFLQKPLLSWLWSERTQDIRFLRYPSVWAIWFPLYSLWPSPFIFSLLALLIQSVCLVPSISNPRRHVSKMSIIFLASSTLLKAFFFFNGLLVLDALATCLLAGFVSLALSFSLDLYNKEHLTAHRLVSWDEPRCEYRPGSRRSKDEGLVPSKVSILSAYIQFVLLLITHFLPLPWIRYLAFLAPVIVILASEVIYFLPIKDMWSFVALTFSVTVACFAFVIVPMWFHALLSGLFSIPLGPG